MSDSFQTLLVKLTEELTEVSGLGTYQKSRSDGRLEELECLLDLHEFKHI